jgi:hypothetical protein
MAPSGDCNCTLIQTRLTRETGESVAGADMVEKQKPEYDIVKQAAKAIKDPASASPKDIKRFAARILNDEKNGATTE